MEAVNRSKETRGMKQMMGGKRGGGGGKRYDLMRRSKEEEGGRIDALRVFASVALRTSGGGWEPSLAMLSLDQPCPATIHHVVVTAPLAAFDCSNYRSRKISTDNKSNPAYQALSDRRTCKIESGPWNELTVWSTRQGNAEITCAIGKKWYLPYSISMISRYLETPVVYDKIMS
ncbi:uncharacterized protein BO97DRAFT_413237 [Aspergillus homomorphus CBS 101889]|uniref:Uncharacterized protein n=1 Tax=Aspergillus homomorphus (strain CBS 101889) TaxID=1450537 RepID=A0A395I1H0_ASPHC|nr:hypothetical protein BO97DRAFT_413237 [Aspergillus homomorphus CBS 101889]RAL13646.1 hypothetical protein BO97DRAFT_413237 [Aspergillus homomorphus CBS 101889]